MPLGNMVETSNGEFTWNARRACSSVSSLEGSALT
jgi:hypothetical protein